MHACGSRGLAKRSEAEIERLQRNVGSGGKPSGKLALAGLREAGHGVFRKMRIRMSRCSVAAHLPASPQSARSISELIQRALETVPVRVPREEAARLVTQYFFKVSARSLERAPVRWQHLNGKAHCSTAELFEWAQTILDAAPPVVGGRKRLRPESERRTSS
jgi:hypothetical protein